MRVQQISVFLDNKPGRIAAVTRALADHGINIRALALADTADFGILRFIASNPDAAVEVLKDAGFAASRADVLAVEIPDEPGGLARVMDILGARGVNVEYLYAFAEPHARKAMVIVRIEAFEDAVTALNAGEIQIAPAETVYNL